MQMSGRKNTLHALKALQEMVPGFEQAKLRNFGMTLGTRDSRKIIGEFSAACTYALLQYTCLVLTDETHTH